MIDKSSSILLLATLFTFPQCQLVCSGPSNQESSGNAQILFLMNDECRVVRGLVEFLAKRKHRQSGEQTQIRQPLEYDVLQPECAVLPTLDRATGKAIGHLLDIRQTMLQMFLDVCFCHAD